MIRAPHAVVSVFDERLIKKAGQSAYPPGHHLLQQHRASRNVATGGADLPAFSIVFNFSGDKTERIDMTKASPIIDMPPDRSSEFTTVVDLPDLEALPANNEQDDAVEQDEDV